MKSEIEEAFFNLSMNWKRASKALFEKAYYSKQEFYAAVLWCGLNGNVGRTVKKEDRNFYFGFLYDHLDEIKNGNFDFFRRDEQSRLNKEPLSWTSKVCHIVNPKAYPIIWDSNIKKALNLNTEEEWMKKKLELKVEFGSKNEIEIYEFDSRIWANIATMNFFNNDDVRVLSI